MNPDHGSEPRQAEKQDPRVFPFGRWLRRTSLDEMPQFWNVLRGEMTLVGPRPHLLEHDAVFADMAAQYPLRRLIKPGLTGLAQIRGLRGRVAEPADMTERVEADIFYLHHWSIALDLKIIILTIKQIFLAPPTAY
jgi:putative colanic acid biosysnthesis UDP-glucose lipid carrier transferase